MKKLAAIRKAILGIIIMGSIVLSPFMSPTSSATELNAYSGISAKFKRSNHNIQIQTGNKKFQIRTEGEIVISDDDKDIIAIEDGGFIEITTKSFGSKRRILIESDFDGILVRQYYVGFSKKDFEPDGREWLARILPEIVRSSGIAAKSRVERFYNKGGVNAVINEIERIDSDYVKTIYVNLLMDKKVNKSELVAILEMVGDEIDSDHYMSEILMKNQKQFTAYDETSEAYINAIRNLDSDHYITTVLKKAIKDESISDLELKKVFKVFEMVESDHYLTTIMRLYLTHRTQDNESLAQALKFARQIDSDHYKVELIKGILKKSVPTDQFSAETFLPFISEINSDHYKVQITNMLIEKMMHDKRDVSAILDLSKQIDSDHYKVRLFYKILDDDNLSDESFKLFYAQIREIDSDHSKTEAIKKVISKSNGELVAFNELLQIVEEIKSDHYSTEVLRLISKQSKLTDDQLIKIFDIASLNIDSDHYLTEALVSFSRRVTDSSERVKAAYRECAKSIKSDTYYGRAMKSFR